MPAGGPGRTFSLRDLRPRGSEAAGGDCVVDFERDEPTFSERNETPTVEPQPGTDFVEMNARPRAGPSVETASQGVVIAERYRLEEPIGIGGMGRVFRARHLQLDKSFALKLLKTDFAGDSASREQFYREARLASSVSHPNIVSVVDFGEDPSEGAFMVMELLDGEMLTTRLQTEGRFPLRLACEVLLQIAEALHYIHGRQIVHCDIKADNILLCPLPSSDRRRWGVKLLDFGLARVRQPTGGRAETIAGTPEYMAPERICGSPPHPSMDIYGLGILAYELITGKRPFDGPMNMVLQAHLYQTPAPFSSLMSEPADERAESLVMRALAKDPRDRQRDMAAFLYELHTLMDMLGFGRRQRGRSAPVTVSRATPQQQTRERAAAAAFDKIPLPVAALSAEGTIVLANPAFARFLTGDKDAKVEGLHVSKTNLVDVYPTLFADLGKVAASNKRAGRTLRLSANDGQAINLEINLTPGMAGQILIGIHRLDAVDR